MMSIRKFIFTTGKLFLLATIPILMLLGVRFLAGADFILGLTIQFWIFVSFVLLIAGFCQLGIDGRGVIQLNYRNILVIVFAVIIGIFYWITGQTFLAWLFLGSVYVLFLGWITSIGSGFPGWKKLLLEGIFLSLAGLLPALVNQIETRFSTEEFFVALEVVGLMVFWLCLRISFSLWNRGKTQVQSRPKLQIRRGWIFTILGLMIFTGAIFIVIKISTEFLSS